MSGARDEEWAGSVADISEPRLVLDSEGKFTGRIWSVRTDTLILPANASNAIFCCTLVRLRSSRSMRKIECC